MNDSTLPVSYKGFCFPRQIISHAVWLYHRFSLSLRDVEEILFVRGIVVTYEMGRQWCRMFGQSYANVLDILVRNRRNKTAAMRFFRELRPGCEYVPRVLITDKLGCHGAAKRECLPSVEHRQSRYLKNRAENSH